jgi:hypothetical protein
LSHDQKKALENVVTSYQSNRAARPGRLVEGTTSPERNRNVSATLEKQQWAAQLV